MALFNSSFVFFSLNLALFYEFCLVLPLIRTEGPVVFNKFFNELSVCLHLSLWLEVIYGQFVLVLLLYGIDGPVVFDKFFNELSVCLYLSLWLELIDSLSLFYEYMVLMDLWYLTNSSMSAFSISMYLASIDRLTIKTDKTRLKVLVFRLCSVL